jgi:hypothetical protein
MLWASSSGVKVQERDALHSFLFSAEVKNA